jgi:Lar family restriction alleviation protein
VDKPVELPKPPPSGSSACSADLLPCPFCGEEPKFESEIVVFHSHMRFRCEGCGVVTPWSFEISDIYRHWNKRRATGLVNWIEAEYAKSGTSSYLNQRSQALKECRKMVRRLLGQ